MASLLRLFIRLAIDIELMPLVVYKEVAPVGTGVEMLVLSAYLVIVVFVGMCRGLLELLVCDVVSFLGLVDIEVTSVAFVVVVLIILELLCVPMLALPQSVFVLRLTNELLIPRGVSEVVATVLGLVEGISEPSAIHMSVAAASTAGRLHTRTLIRLKTFGAMDVLDMLWMLVLFHFLTCKLQLRTHFCIILDKSDSVKYVPVFNSI
jgi:hypothetical protein